MEVVDFFRKLGLVLTSDWRPVVEIAAIAALIYAVLRFMRVTRGAAALRGAFFAGLASLVTLAVLARAAGLDRLTWTIERLAGLSLVGVLVVFQPEIRRALVRMGGGLIPLRREGGMLDQLIEAVASLSKRKTGALLAIEREHDLEDYARGGVALDAEVSAQLLASVFAPKAPLHDGASILRAGRVVAAGCLLPLSENPDVAKSLGTRHRAGVGLTEETDAVTVIVSSVTGRISLAVRGELMEGLSVEDLRNILTRLCSVSETEPATAD